MTVTSGIKIRVKWYENMCQEGVPPAWRHPHRTSSQACTAGYYISHKHAFLHKLLHIHLKRHLTSTRLIQLGYYENIQKEEEF
jgi:hypothetical protein